VIFAVVTCMLFYLVAEFGVLSPNAGVQSG
jgi:hypothetical protein